jgi:hypothetical protein
MPCINFQIDPCIGPLLDLGISAPLSLAPTGIRPTIYWFKAVADTGSTNTCVSPNAIAQAGLPLTGQAQVGTINVVTTTNVYSADLFLRYVFAGGINEFAFRNLPVTQLIAPSANNDALLGMDILRLGIFVINGHTMTGTFCW